MIDRGFQYAVFDLPEPGGDNPKGGEESNGLRLTPPAHPWRRNNANGDVAVKPNTFKKEEKP
jgi:hypothetical protein